MQRSTLTLLSFLLATAFLVHDANATCGKCQSNGIACTSKNTYRVCHEGDVQSDKEYTCPSGVCTRLDAKCLENAKPYCDPNEGCDSCDGEKMFTCTSRTTFAQCNGREMTTNTGKCPDDTVCDSSELGLCVLHCGSTFECDRPALVV